MCIIGIYAHNNPYIEESTPVFTIIGKAYASAGGHQRRRMVWEQMKRGNGLINYYECIAAGKGDINIVKNNKMQDTT